VEYGGLKAEGTARGLAAFEGIGVVHGERESLLKFQREGKSGGETPPAGPLKRLAVRSLDSWYRHRLGKSVIPAAYPIVLPEIRNRIVQVLAILSEASLPEVPQQPANSFTKWFFEARRITRRNWRTYYSMVPITQDNQQKLSFWGIPTLYADDQLDRFFDFGRFQPTFNDRISDPIQVGPEVLEGSTGASFTELIRIAQTLQVEWAANHFVLPEPEFHEGCLYGDLFRFSGQLIPGLALISDFLESLRLGAVLRPGYSEMMKESIAACFKAIAGQRGSMADLLFMHGATCKLFSFLPHPPGSSDFLELPAQLDSGSPISDILLTLLLHNPLSLLLQFGSLCDSALLDSATEVEIATLFEMPIGSEAIFWLANHACSNLMSSRGLPVNPEGEGTSDQIERFARRMRNMNALLGSLQKIMPGRGATAAAVRLFLIRFYELLLREWLQECDRRSFQGSPLPVPGCPGIPSKIRFSLFSLGAKHSGRCEEVESDLARGGAFNDIAAKYTDDYLERSSQGDRGWVERGSLPNVIEGPLFLFAKDGVPFHFQANGNNYYMLIRERQPPATANFFERLVLWAGTDGEALRGAALALLDPLELFLTAPDAETADDFDDF